MTWSMRSVSGAAQGLAAQVGLRSHYLSHNLVLSDNWKAERNEWDAIGRLSRVHEGVHRIRPLNLSLIWERHDAFGIPAASPLNQIA